MKDSSGGAGGGVNRSGTLGSLQPIKRARCVHHSEGGHLLIIIKIHYRRCAQQKEKQRQRNLLWIFKVLCIEFGLICNFYIAKSLAHCNIKIYIEQEVSCHFAQIFSGRPTCHE